MRRWMAVVLLFAVLLCGCMQSVELKERGIVQAIGVDYDDGFYTVTLQIFNPQSTGQTSFDASKLNNKVIQVQGSSISDALRRATLQNGRKMFLGNNKIIVIGRETAEGGISRCWITLILTTRPVRGRWSSWPTAGRMKLSPPKSTRESSPPMLLRW